MSFHDQTLYEWARQFRATLSPETRQLIAEAQFDLLFGPNGLDDIEGNWPGFGTALFLISEALEAVPSVLYIDTMIGCWSETEPEPTACDACHGEVPENENDYQCPVCLGNAEVVCSGDYVKVERRQLISAIVGKEMGAYL